MKSSYQLRNISIRNTYANGTSVTAGPPVNASYPLGYFREDYEYMPTSLATPDFLDQHNGRFCVTPEYPNGTYAYFCTVDANWNSAYPYAVGPTFYGVRTALKVTSITETVSNYLPSPNNFVSTIDELMVNIFPSPASDFIAIQIGQLNNSSAEIQLYDLQGKLIATSLVKQGSTIAYFDTRLLYNGTYLIKLSGEGKIINKRVIIFH